MSMIVYRNNTTGDKSNYLEGVSLNATIKNELIVNGDYKRFLDFRKMLFLADGVDHNNKEYYKEMFGENVETLFSISNSMHQRKTRNRNDILKWIFAIRNIKNIKTVRLFSVL